MENKSLILERRQKAAETLPYCKVMHLQWLKSTYNDLLFFFFFSTQSPGASHASPHKNVSVCFCDHPLSIWLITIHLFPCMHSQLRLKCSSHLSEAITVKGSWKKFIMKLHLLIYVLDILLKVPKESCHH